jgi:hypothetical protein
VNLEEELQKVAIADTCRVKLDLDGLGVRAMISIGRIRYVAARIPDTCSDNAWELPNQVLHAPEATSGKYSAFKSAC